MRRLIRWLPLIACVVLTTSCSVVSLGYFALPTYALWQIERYFSFDDTQREQVRLALNDLHTWHKRNELTEYRRILVEAKARAARPLVQADLAWFTDQINKRWVATAERVALPAAELALTLKSEQLQQMRKRFEILNKESREKFFQPDLKERSAKRLERTVDRYEDFFGELSDAQKQTIATYLTQIGPNDDWFAERNARQKSFADLLEKIRVEQPQKDLAARWLRDYMVNAPTTVSPSRKAYFDRSLKLGDEMTLQLHSSLTANQQAHLSKKLEGWAGDVAALISTKQ
jgi:Family of unknown function (DUF6279)